jgi:hypothetical protein
MSQQPAQYLTTRAITEAYYQGLIQGLMRLSVASISKQNLGDLLDEVEQEKQVRLKEIDDAAAWTKENPNDTTRQVE